MPYTFDKLKIRLPRHFDRRVKLTGEDKANIKRLYNQGISIRGIAGKYKRKCSRRMIQFILFPERLELVKAQFKERRKDGRYYNKEANTMAIRKTRQWKYSLKLILPKEKLIPFTWYYGLGRNANVGFWDGRHFNTIGRCYKEARMYQEGYYEKDGGTFKPFRTLKQAIRIFTLKEAAQSNPAAGLGMMKAKREAEKILKEAEKEA